jgi:hypothetical protein
MNCGLRHFGNDVMQLSAPRICRDFGSALPFQTCLIQTKPVPPLSNEHGSHVKDQGRRQFCHNKHKKFPYRPTRDVSLVPGHASYTILQTRVSLYHTKDNEKRVYTLYGRKEKCLAKPEWRNMKTRANLGDANWDERLLSNCIIKTCGGIWEWNNKSHDKAPWRVLMQH